MAKAEKVDFKYLKFIRVLVPHNITLIPLELIEGVKGRTFTTRQFLDYQHDQIVNNNPNNLLYILVDTTKNIVKGFLWAEIYWDRSLFVNTFSISKEYWGKGDGIYLATDFLENLTKKMNISKVNWMTTNEKFYVKKGFKKSKIKIMEYQRAS